MHKVRLKLPGSRKIVQYLVFHNNATVLVRSAPLMSYRITAPFTHYGQAESKELNSQAGGATEAKDDDDES